MSVANGQGASARFCRFTRSADELAAMTGANPAFAAATNPVMNLPPPGLLRRAVAPARLRASAANARL